MRALFAGARAINVGKMYNARLDGLTDYPFQRLAALLADLDAPADTPPVAMSIGEPQHAAPDALHLALAANARDWNKYPPTNGTADFRAAVGDWLTARYQLPQELIDPKRHVLPVAGSREGLFMAALLAVPPEMNGSRPAVLMPNPFYQVYLGAAVMTGADPVLVPATAETGFQPDYAGVDEATLARTALAYVCSPANPQGTVMDLEKLKAAIRLAREHDFVLVCDECYSEIYFDAPPPGALQACAEMGGSLKNVLVFNSLSKRSSVPGLRSGFVAGDDALLEKFARLRAHGATAQPLPVLAAAAALWRDEKHAAANRRLYGQKVEDAAAVFGSRFGFRRPEGGFFLWLDVGDGIEAARTLWRKAGIKVLPGAFLSRDDDAAGNPGAAYIRVAMVHDRQTNAQALKRLNDCL